MQKILQLAQEYINADVGGGNLIRYVIQDADNREHEQRKTMTSVKNGQRKLIFSLFQCSDSTNPYNGSYNEGILIRCVRQQRSIKPDIELPVAIHNVRDVSILVA